MTSLQQLGKVWETGASQGWDFALASQADKRAREKDEGEAMLERIGAAWWQGPNAWERLRAAEADLAHFPHGTAPVAIAWLRGFLDGMGKLEGATHRFAGEG